jgi:hypothetical protein
VTLLHPLFFTNNATRTMEIEEDADGRRFTVRAIKVKEYLDVAPHKAGLYLPKASTKDSQVILVEQVRTSSTDDSSDSLPPTPTRASRTFPGRRAHA